MPRSPSPPPGSSSTDRHLHPTAGDGRHIDPRLGTLSGEGAGITVRDPDTAWPVADGLQPNVTAASDAVTDTYYDLPVVKAPPWKWYVPTYFAFGGLAGAASSLAGALHLTASQPRLARQLHLVALGGEALGAGLLIADLGRPSRFHHMLRVFRPTSPMNLGTWILSTTGATTALGLLTTTPHPLHTLLHHPRRFFSAQPAPRVPHPARFSPRALVSRPRSLATTALSLVGILSGTALATYTGVLIGNTAIPLWNATRDRLPVWFAALSAASLGSVLELVAPFAPITRIYAPVAKTAQLAAAAAVTHTARAAAVDAPLRRGRARTLWRTATWLNLASLAATVASTLRPTRSLATLAGALGLASTAVSRFAIAAAGHASAADPRATFVPQRAHTTPAAT